jgi:hypothetical protein
MLLAEISIEVKLARRALQRLQTKLATIEDWQASMIRAAVGDALTLLDQRILDVLSGKLNQRVFDALSQLPKRKAGLVPGLHTHGPKRR